MSFKGVRKKVLLTAIQYGGAETLCSVATSHGRLRQNFNCVSPKLMNNQDQTLDFDKQWITVYTLKYLAYRTYGARGCSDTLSW